MTSMNTDSFGLLLLRHRAFLYMYVWRSTLLSGYDKSYVRMNLSNNNAFDPLEIHRRTIFLESRQFCNKQNNNINMIKVSMAQWPPSYSACCCSYIRLSICCRSSTYFSQATINRTYELVTQYCIWLRNNLTSCRATEIWEIHGRTTTGHHRNPSTL